VNNYYDRCKLLNISNSIHESLFDLEELLNQEKLFSYPTENSLEIISRKDFLDKVSSLGSYLKEQGVNKGSKIAILSNTRAEWLIADLAILSLGAVSVSIYQSLIPSEIAFILDDSKCSFIFIENQEQLKKIEEITQKKWEIPAIEDRAKKEVEIKLNGIISFEKVSSNTLEVKNITDLNNNYPPKNDHIDKTTLRNDLASIVYTSGTTGAPKGVMQTHGNHLSNVRQVLESGLMLNEGSIFLFLPLAHSFARLMGYISLFSELALKFPQITDTQSSKVNTLTLSNNIRESNAEIIPVVPRLLEKIKSQIENQSTKSGLSNKLLKKTLEIATKNYEKSSVLNKINYYLTSPIRNKIIKKIFGNNFRYCVSGGAKLPISVHAFFDSLGILILQGYGLTETCVATNVCRPNKNKVGSVGPVLSPDIEIKINSDEEILIRGPNIAIGYLNRPLATKEAWNEENWFLTGDQGHLDEENFLFITGRKKELIVTSGGKKIPPGIIEEKILQYSIFSQVIVIGNDRKYCTAITYLNEEAICQELDIPKSSYKLEKSKVTDLVNAYLDKININLASYESIKKVIISDFEFTQENGLLTPSLKIKRNEVEKRFKDEIEKIYS
jgi:long-chain acyl-CoA synthetase